MNEHCDVSYVLVSYVANSYDGGTRWDVYGHEAPAVNDKMGSFTTEENALVFANSHGLPVVKGGMDAYRGTIGKLCDKVQSKLEAALRDDGLDNDNALPRRDYRDVHDARIAAIEEYRARLLALIDDKETP